MDVWKGSYVMEAKKIVDQVSTNIMISRIREQKFLYRGSVERVLCHGSIEDCADPLLCINHHNDSQDKRGEVPTLKVWKVSYDVEEKTIVLILCWISSTITIPRTREEKSRPKSVEHEFRCMTNLLNLYNSININNLK